MNLPDGIKHAVQLGANEAILEWTCDPTEAALDTLGASYQAIGDDAANAGDAKRYIADLAAWDDGTTTGSPGAKFEQLMCKAGIEFARGLIAKAAGIGTVPARVKPYMAELAPLVAALAEALGGKEVDEDSLPMMIWGNDEGD
jgi:hypothetical protein